VSRPEARIPLADLPAPGRIHMVDLGGHRVGLVRVGDEVHALADRCPHRGAPLCSGGRTVHGIALGDGVPVRGAERALLRCPWHKWDFDIASGRCVVHPTLRVRRYRVTVADDEVIVHLEHPASPAPGARRTA
jgi:nitrite reductase/ring-hydroxylating ferredoxin subunit